MAKEFRTDADFNNAVNIAGVLTASTGNVVLTSNTTVGGSAVVTTTGTQTLSNKTLTSPTISTIINTGTLTLPTTTDTLIGASTTATLTNKTINLSSIADTATAATNYFVETGSDGIIRPKTLANARTEIVTTAAVNAAAATTVGTITSGVWQGSSIATTYTDAKVTSVNGSTGAVSGLAPTAGPTFSGNVGIGTSGSYPLHISSTSAPTILVQNGSTTSMVSITGAGESYATDFMSTAIRQYATAATGSVYTVPTAALGALTFQNTTNALIGTNGGSPLIFATTSTERMRIEGAGNILVKRGGSSSTTIDTAAFSVTDTTGGISPVVINQVFSGTSQPPGIVLGTVHQSSTSTWIAINFKRNISTTTQSVIGGIAVTNTAATAPTFSTASDYRMKKNVRDLNTAELFSKVTKLKPRLFDLKDERLGVDVKGFIAHEVHDIIPEMVIGQKDAVDTNGDPIMQNLTDIPTIYLIASIQELSKTVERLQERIAYLESTS